MAKVSLSKVYDLIGLIYENAHSGSADAWREVYAEMAAALSTGPGGVMIFDTGSGEFRALIGTVAPEVFSDYQTLYRQASPFTAQMMRLKAGERLNRREFMPDAAFESTPIYRDFYSRAGIYHFEYQVFLVRAHLQGAVVFTRPKRKKNFGRDELDAMAMITPHLARAFEAYLDLYDTRRQNRIMLEAFDRIPQGVAVVDAGHKLIFVNNSVREVLAGGGGLEIDAAGRLTATSGADAKLLRSRLDEVLAPAGGDSGTNLLQISRPSGGRPIELLITPFSDAGQTGGGDSPMAMLFVSNPDQKLENIAGILRQMYGLTSAEARLASMLADGHTLKDSGDLLDIKTNTVRTHLKRIFCKTGTNRQSELVKLILKGPASLRGAKPRPETSAAPDVNA